MGFQRIENKNQKESEKKEDIHSYQSFAGGNGIKKFKFYIHNHLLSLVSRVQNVHFLLTVIQNCFYLLMVDLYVKIVHTFVQYVKILFEMKQS